MATTESRSGFRLPWSPSHDASEERPEGARRTDDSEISTPELEPAEALEPTSQPDADAATEVDPGAAEAVAPVPDDEPAAPVAPVAAIADPAPARRPTKFLADMTHAMQAAAEQARAATLEQFRVEGSTYIEQIRGRSVADANALRRRADTDIASIKEWSKAEIVRIREETENRIAGRRGQLDGQLGRHAALVERDLVRIEGQIATFDAEMATFFDELLAETDLPTLAARAQQMPEAPAFDKLDDTAFAALMSEPAVGIPVAEPEPAALAAEAPADAATAPTATPSRTGDLSFDREAAMAAIQAAAEAAASVEAATAEAARAEAAADRAETAAGHDAGERDVAPPSAPDDDSPARDPRLAILGLTPDFATAEAAAAEAAAAEILGHEDANEAGFEDDIGIAVATRLAGRAPSSTFGVSTNARPAAPLVSTQVVVTGLVSVASIASFKRHLGRHGGVRRVGVSSGPDGEFLFTVQHEAEVALRDLIPTLPGFQARVTGGGEGIVTASARDPED